jgi:hypothetical protein
MSLSAIWNAFVAFLVWLSADPAAIDREAPKAAAAVAAARASMLAEAPAPAPPTPTACDCGATCVRGVWKPDGRIEQRCSCKCKRCEAERATGKPAVCTTGTCR